MTTALGYRLIGLDFETYASTDLVKHGLNQYVNCADFTPLVAVTTDEQGTTTVFDFVQDWSRARDELTYVLNKDKDSKIVAHNAGFEKAVLNRLGIFVDYDRFIDSAVVARASGAAGKLEAAAPQLLGMDKLETGWPLIQLFSIPGKYQVQSGRGTFDPQIVSDHPQEWIDFIEYCRVDAELSLRLALRFLPDMNQREDRYNEITMRMNDTGWYVDLPLVLEMQRRYELNLELAVAKFREDCDAQELNLNSHPQLKAWCAERGVRAKSFDEAHVASMLKSLEKKMSSGTLPDDKAEGYMQVVRLLHTKQVMGGSSLKKLQTILDTVGVDGRLHDQYLHVGAGATYRTTGRGVQMQNLKRLNGAGDDMAELFDESAEWDNTKLANNLRQVFCAQDPHGFLIVGDFSSVESRGLAWQAGELWKLEAYWKGHDIYKELAAKSYGKPVASITKPERTFGKVGELSCGYGAGAEAVREFAAKMGVALSEMEATKLVYDWREANPNTVHYWKRLDEALHKAIEDLRAQYVTMPLAAGRVEIVPFRAPASLVKQTGSFMLQSLRIKMIVGNRTVLTRVIHGAHTVGRNIHYWKPSERKTGDLWSDTYVSPKTKRLTYYTVYGGKLAGLLTQSMCRELFFDVLDSVDAWVEQVPNLKVVGQFHDEIVLEWQPMARGIALLDTVSTLSDEMSKPMLPQFPLTAEVKFDYRYTK